ncbi:DJ-1/PfpI family protein [Mycobacterium sp. E3247]|uniref:DJ-1/PfpI family protein n=1 Tax=Mycobacterium sp. E3247 TaxID=1856864 RepID=UPI0007FE2067|nr:DJ-1/PfpI family protein [Mycobacterium sp. E3247]OBH01568.1 glutamine amidotransferase [Mycobacterium sp. E3247]
MSDNQPCVTRIAMLLYPQFTTLDLIGPHQVLTCLPDTQVDLFAKSSEAVTADSGVCLLPDKSFDQAGEHYDVLFVPGAVSTHLIVEDGETLSFLAAVGGNARYVTSVCTGSLVLAAAGLLAGYRASSHWAFRDLLTVYGAIPESGRIVVDRNRITGGGVTAGVDFGLHLAALLAGEDTAKMVELLLEYDPDPPFNVGHPSRADAKTLLSATERLAPLVKLMRDASERGFRD